MSAPIVFTEHQYAQQNVALIGYGVSGKACVQYLLSKGAIVSVFDRTTHNVKNEESAKLRFYSLNENTQLRDFDLVVVSPGVNLQQPFILNYLQSVTVNSVMGNAKKRESEASKAVNADSANFVVGTECVIGDIELFARELAFQKASNVASTSERYPLLVGITGSNGKSTVVDMLSKALSFSGLKVGLGGNFGTSALDMLNQDYDIIVLELSSFQLESTYSLALDVACVLNVTPDHIDRHGTMQTYAKTKRKIYEHAAYVIYNRDDPQTYLSAHLSTKDNSASVGMTQTINDGNTNLYFQNKEGVWHQSEGVTQQLLRVSTPDNICAKTVASNAKSSTASATMSASDLSTSNHHISSHQLMNMQVVFACCNALAEQIDIDVAKIEQSLHAYKGLAHRFQTVKVDQAGTWINDSKATNAGASIAAINALVANQKEIVLIAGGDAKDADLSEWYALVNLHVTFTILIGQDAQKLAAQLTHCSVVSDLAAAVSLANQYLLQTEQGVVLLSPACASIDMFDNFEQRGDVFTHLARQQVTA